MEYVTKAKLTSNKLFVIVAIVIYIVFILCIVGLYSPPDFIDHENEKKIKSFNSSDYEIHNAWLTYNISDVDLENWRNSFYTPEHKEASQKYESQEALNRSFQILSLLGFFVFIFPAVILFPFVLVLELPGSDLYSTKIVMDRKNITLKDKKGKIIKKYKIVDIRKFSITISGPVSIMYWASKFVIEFKKEKISFLIAKRQVFFEDLKKSISFHGKEATIDLSPVGIIAASGIRLLWYTRYDSYIVRQKEKTNFRK